MHQNTYMAATVAVSMHRLRPAYLSAVSSGFRFLCVALCVHMTNQHQCDKSPQTG
jgi:hypothetical protein